MIQLTARKKISTAKFLTRAAILSAIAFVLMYIELPLPFIPPWLKLDFSDIPALLGGFALGPIAGIIIEGIKCLLFLLIRGTMTGGVGELANFLIGVAFVLPASLVYAKMRSKKGALIASLVGIAAGALVAALLNYTVLIPFYAQTGLMPMEAIIAACQLINPAADSLMGYVLIFAMPFTAAKFAADSAIVFLLYKKLSRFLQKS